jgi:rubrerythrin
VKRFAGRANPIYTQRVVPAGMAAYSSKGENNAMQPINTLNEVLNFAIGEEQAAVEFYTSLAAQTPSADMRQILEEVAQEERKHEARLKEMQAQGIRPTGRPNTPDLKIADYLVEIKPGPALSYRELLMLAMQKELAAVRMYTALADIMVDPSLQEVFRQLAQEESKHKLKFETEYDNVMVEG